MRALGENKSVDDRLWPLLATAQTARSLPLCRPRRRMLQGQPLSPSSRVRAYLTQVARSRCRSSSMGRLGQTDGHFDAARVAAVLLRAQSTRPLPRFDSTRRETMPLLGSSFTAGATIPSKRSRRPDRPHQHARSVRMMNHPRHSDYALLTCVAVAAVAAFLALAAMLSKLSCTPERPPEEYVPIRLVPLE